MERFIRIQSTINITVTGDIDFIKRSDVSEFGGQISTKDSWKVEQRWSGNKVALKQGVGYYPACIAEWNTVKSLVDNGIITLGGFVNESALTPEELKKVEEVEKTLKNYTDRTHETKVKFGQAEEVVKEEKKVVVEEVKPVEVAKPEATPAAAPKSFDDILKSVQG